jgi:glyoxylase-like metal-dependent hydrolase (beta-lactamase superfamily II)
VTLKLYAFTCGHITGDKAGFLEGEPGKIKVPVPAYLIDHPKGKVLFDTGMNIGLRQDAARLLGPMAAQFEIDFPERTDIAARLQAMDIDPAEIRHMVMSHLHFDHCGGNPLIPNATVVVQRAEWKAGKAKMMREMGVYDPENFDTGHDVIEIEGEHDLFGDGSVVLFATFGHTPGHQSMRVKLESGDVILAADCCYLKQTLDNLHLPNFAYDRDASIESLKLLRRLQAEGSRIFYGHDPDFWKSVPQAPSPIA